MTYKGKEITWKRYKELQKAKTISPMDRYQQRMIKTYEQAVEKFLRRYGY